MAKAGEPEDLTRLFVDAANAGDAAALAELYEPDAVVDYPSGRPSVGRAAIRDLYTRMLARVSRFEPEEPLPTLRSGDLALTATRRRDGRGIRVQVARRQADGTWLRVIDWPEPPTAQRDLGRAAIAARFTNPLGPLPAGRPLLGPRSRLSPR